MLVLSSIIINVFEVFAEPLKTASNIRSFILDGRTILIIVIIIILIFYYRNIFQWFYGAYVILKGVISIFGATKMKDVDSILESIKEMGYEYDPYQDIFYSTLNPWQKHYGYCRLYDETAVAMGMVINCEPIYFKYDNKKWLIEFWKGQYDLATGFEIGIYNTTGPSFDIPGYFDGTFYNGAESEDYLTMYCSLEKNGITLFAREEKHWWLTGFKLGEFSEPSELTMYIRIIFKDREMRDEFVKGLNNAGYSNNEIDIHGENIVSLVFDKPRTPQPMTRIENIDKIIQKRNESLCYKYQEITAGHNTLEDKLSAIQSEAPEMLKYIVGFGRPKKSYKGYKKVKKYL
jgi:hypothetical protein